MTVPYGLIAAASSRLRVCFVEAVAIAALLSAVSSYPHQSCPPIPPQNANCRPSSHSDYDVYLAGEREEELEALRGDLEDVKQAFRDQLESLLLTNSSNGANAVSSSLPASVDGAQSTS